MGQDTVDGINENSVEDMVRRYKEPVKMLLPYLDWLKEHMDVAVATNYSGDLDHSIHFPVYDSTLLTFVKVAQGTGQMDRNWPYVYRRNRMETPQDERRFIERAQIMDMADLFGIISKYVLSGMTRGNMWSEGVTNGSMYYAIEKMRELLHFWGEREL